LARFFALVAADAEDCGAAAESLSYKSMGGLPTANWCSRSQPAPQEEINQMNLSDSIARELPAAARGFARSVLVIKDIDSLGQ
jgi:hypothetical protein